MQLVLLLLFLFLFFLRYAMIQSHLETHALSLFFFVSSHPQVTLSCTEVCTSVVEHQFGGGSMVPPPSRVLCCSEDRVFPQASGEGHSQRLHAYLSSDPWNPPDLLPMLSSAETSRSRRESQQSLCLCPRFLVS